MAYGDLGYRCDPGRTALVVVDVQVDFCRPPDGDAEMLETMEAMATRLEQLIAAARKSGVPVVFIKTVHGSDSDSQAWRSRRGPLSEYGIEKCQPGTEGVEFFRVSPAPSETVITKHRYDAFVGTDLNALLGSLGRESVIITGVMTDICVETTLRHAICLDYLATIVSDCCAAKRPDRHELALERVTQSFGLVASGAEIAEIWGAAELIGADPLLVKDLRP